MGLKYKTLFERTILYRHRFKCRFVFPDTVNMVPCGQACPDGAVDLDDILSVLAAFAGDFQCDHPCPGGACCLGDGSCQDWDDQPPGTTPPGGMSETACGDTGGTYQGNGTTCADVACP